MAWVFSGSWLLCLRKAKRPSVVGVKRSAPFVVLGLMALAPERLSAQQQFQVVGINQVSSTRVTKNAMGLRVHGDRAEHRGRSDWSDRHGDE